MNIIDFANQVIEMSYELEEWKHRAKRAEYQLEQYTQHTQESIAQHEQTFGKLLSAALDPDSGINRAVRAVQRDPLKGAQKE